MRGYQYSRLYYPFSLITLRLVTSYYLTFLLVLGSILSIFALVPHRYAC